MDMNRRTFLKAGAATALGLALSGAFPTKTTAHAEEAVSLPEDFASMLQFPHIRAVRPSRFCRSRP